jgi:SOS-response transcriptional repressor LexA
MLKTSVMNSLGNKICEFRKAKGLSLRQLAKKTGIASSSIHKIESGDTANPGAVTVQKLANALGVSPEMLMGLATTKHAGLSLVPQAPNVVNLGSPDGFYRFPCKGYVSAGGLTQAIETEDIVYYEFAGIDEYSSDMFCLEVRGDSMNPPVPDRAIILVRSARNMRHKGWYVILTTDGQSTFKMIEFNESRAVLKPLNPAYEPIKLGHFDFSQVYEVLEIKIRPPR